MKNSFNVIVVFFILFLFSCKTKNQPINSDSNVVDSVSVSYVDSVIVEEEKALEEFNERPINIDSVLKLNVDIEKEFISDSLYNAIGPVGEYQLYSGQVVAFTRLEKEGNVFAIVCPNIDSDFEENVKIDFYRLQNKKWIYLNSSEVDNVVYFQSVDLNNDGIFEIQSVGHFNMNGNCYNYFFGFNALESKFYNGGNFFSSQYNFKPNDSRIDVNYEGSWYAPNIKYIYYWKNQRLIPFKEVEVGLKYPDMNRKPSYYIKYSENLNLDKDSVQFIYKKTYRGKKLNDFFDNFFENK
jgi:hypothetical protein